MAGDDPMDEPDDRDRQRWDDGAALCGGAGGAQELSPVPAGGRRYLDLFRGDDGRKNFMGGHTPCCRRDRGGLHRVGGFDRIGRDRAGQPAVGGGEVYRPFPSGADAGEPGSTDYLPAIGAIAALLAAAVLLATGHPWAALVLFLVAVALGVAWYLKKKKTAGG